MAEALEVHAESRHNVPKGHEETQCTQRTRRDTMYPKDTKRHNVPKGHEETQCTQRTRRDTMYPKDTKRHNVPKGHEETQCTQRTRRDTMYPKDTKSCQVYDLYRFRERKSVSHVEVILKYYDRLINSLYDRKRG